MKGLSSLERIVLESLEKKSLTFNEIKELTALKENICFNILQSLVVRSIVKTNGVSYQISDHLSPQMISEINGEKSKRSEAFELIEATIESSHKKQFKIKKFALDERDEKIFLAMLSNLESFLADAHKKNHKNTPVKDQTLVFWGVANVNKVIDHMIEGDWQ